MRLGCTVHVTWFWLIVGGSLYLGLRDEGNQAMKRADKAEKIGTM